MKFLYRLPMLWEIIRYSPRILNILYCMTAEMKNHLMTEIGYLHYYLEDSLDQHNVRSLNWNEAMRLVKSLVYSKNNLIAVWNCAVGMATKTLVISDIRTGQDRAYF